MIKDTVQVPTLKVNFMTKDVYTKTTTAPDELYAVEVENNISIPLFTSHWIDHAITDPLWLRADNYFWYTEADYKNAYDHIVDDYESASGPETETIGDITITFYTGTDGHKICLLDQESNLANLYTATGVAWYYLLDTTNKKFKLPRMTYTQPYSSPLYLYFFVGTSGMSGGNFLPNQGGHTGEVLVTDGQKTQWKPMSSRQIGETIFSILPQNDPCLHLMDGSLLQGNGTYRAFVSYIAGLYDPDNIAPFFTDEASWQQSVTTYGVCGKFVYDSVNNTVRLPKVTGFVEGTIDSSALGSLVEAGIPNHWHMFGWNAVNNNGTFCATNNNFLLDQPVNSNVSFGHRGWNGSGGGGDFDGSDSTAYSGNMSTTVGIPSEGTNGSGALGTTYGVMGKSSTVQPQAIKGYYYIVVANGITGSVPADISQIIAIAQNKANTDLSNISNVARGTKENIIGWGLPDFDSGITSTLPYTAPSNGIISIDPGDNRWWFIYVNGVLVAHGDDDGDGTNTQSLILPVRKNDVITCNYNRGIIFFPMQGATL